MPPTVTPGTYLALPTTGEDPVQIKAITVSAGTASAGQIPSLLPNGKFDPSFIDSSGYGAPDTEVGTASEALTAGDIVNTFPNAGVNGVRRANASSFDTRAMGFVRESVASGATITVYKSGAQNAQVVGLNIGQQWLSASQSQVVGLNIGQQWLSASQSGKAVNTPPNVSGGVNQKIGYASSSSTLHIKIEPAYGVA